MPCHCRSIFSAIIPTMSTEVQRNISSHYRWGVEAWSDIVSYTRQPHKLPVGQKLEQFMIYPVLGKGLRFQVLCKESLRRDRLAPGGRWVQPAALCARCRAERPQPAGASSTAALCNYSHRAAGHERLLQVKRTRMIFLVTHTNYLNTFLPLKATLQDSVKILFQ